MKTVKQDPVASHLPSMAGSTYPNVCFSDASGRQNDTSENMSVSTASVVVSKKGHQGNKKDLQLPGQSLSVTSEGPCKSSDGSDMLPNHLPTYASGAKDHAMQSSDGILENSLARRIGGSAASAYKVPEGNRRNIRALKLSLKSVNPEKKSDNQNENMAPNHLSSQSGFSNLQKRPLDAVSRKKFSGGPALAQQNPNTEQQPSNTNIVSNEDCNQGLKMQRRRLSLKSELPRVDNACEKDSKPPNHPLSDKKLNELPSSAAIPKGELMAPNELPLSAPAVLKSQSKALGFAGGQKDSSSDNCSTKETTVAIEKVIVSDSEDSADERERPPRSRLSLMRRRLAGKF
jgi:ubiquitin-conjugating enzyme E2 T